MTGTKPERRTTKEMAPVDAVRPTPAQRVFLEAIIRSTTEYAWAKALGDFRFLGYPQYRYFCAYKSTGTRRGFGSAIFGFERKRTGLFFVFPEAVGEERAISSPWTQKPTPRRRKILIDDTITPDLHTYLIGLAKRSIDICI
jgi:hypothetical protein